MKDEARIYFETMENKLINGYESEIKTHLFSLPYEDQTNLELDISMVEYPINVLITHLYGIGIKVDGLKAKIDDLSIGDISLISETISTIMSLKKARSFGPINELIMLRDLETMILKGDYSGDALSEYQKKGLQ